MLILEENFKRHYSIIGFGLGQNSGIQAFGNKLIPVSHKKHLYIDVLHMLFSKHMEFTRQIDNCSNISLLLSVRMESPGDPSGPPRTPHAGGARGLPMGRRLPASISQGRLPTMRSRDLTLGGVKKVTIHSWTLQSHKTFQMHYAAIHSVVFSFVLQKTFTPNIIGRKSKEE